MNYYCYLIFLPLFDSIIERVSKWGGREMGRAVKGHWMQGLNRFKVK